METKSILKELIKATGLCGLSAIDKVKVCYFIMALASLSVDTDATPMLTSLLVVAHFALASWLIKGVKLNLPED